MVVTDSLTGLPQSPLLRRDHRARAEPAPALRNTAVAGVPRHRPVQEHQRHARSRRRRQHPAGGRGLSDPACPQRRLRVPLGRRRIPGPALVPRGGSAPEGLGAPERVQPIADGRRVAEGVGLSFGCAEVSALADSASEALNLADERMYADKRAGCRCRKAAGRPLRQQLGTRLSPDGRRHCCTGQRYSRYFARSRRQRPSAAAHDDAIAAGSSPARIRARPSREPNSRSADSSSNFEPYRRFSSRGQLDPQPHGPQRLPVRDHQEHSLAFLFRVLARQRREAHRIEPDPGDRPRIQRLRELHAVDPGSADLFERRVGAASDRDVRGLRSRQRPDRPSPAAGCACSATG